MHYKFHVHFSHIFELHHGLKVCCACPWRIWMVGLHQVPIISCVNLRLRWGLKQSYSFHRNLFNSMWHTTCMQVNQGDSLLLVVGSQIGSLAPNPSFGHNLCFKYPNGSCEPMLGIYVLRYFQWYKERCNPMGFDPYNYFMNIQESIRTLTPKAGAHLGMWGFILSHSCMLPGTWNVILGLHS